MEYKPTIGLEIHAELKTRTKMFCDSLNDPEEKHPNRNVCPVCMGHPGTLPAMNKKAIESVLKVGLALGGTINPTAKFDRKNYFYPDLPKAYQISQYDKPLVSGGTLHGIHVRRVHLEEDTGTLIHDDKENVSLVDFNRAGVPLMELVTEPDITSGEQAVAFARELQLILKYLGVADADMEKGQMRIEANISLNMGTKVEVKNINSFKAVEGAIRYELARQEKALEKGEKIHQETRGWDEAGQKTVSQRSKEEAHDYRYFPEPDLPLFETSVFDIETLRMGLPELPEQKRKRFRDVEKYGLSEKQLELFISEPKFAEFFEDAASEAKEMAPEIFEVHTAAVLGSYSANDLRGFIKELDTDIEALKFTPENFAHLAVLIAKGKILSRQAKDILKRMFETGADPEEIMKSENIGLVSDEDSLEKVVKEVIAENPTVVADYKRGKTAAVQFLVGRAMGKLKGQGDPVKLRELFLKDL